MDEAVEGQAAGGDTRPSAGPSHLASAMGDGVEPYSPRGAGNPGPSGLTRGAGEDPPPPAPGAASGTTLPQERWPAPQ